MNERDLEHLAGRLGRRDAQSVDPDRVAGRVVARLDAAERRSPGRGWRWAVVGAAAVLVGAVGFGLRSDKTVEGPTGPASAITIATLDALSSEELDEVLDSLSVAAPVSDQLAGLDDLDAGQLSELLARMEG